MTFIGSIVLSLPAIIAAVLGIFVDPSWHRVALFSGIGIGLVVVVVGVWRGSRTFERRGPEILSSALRA
ncbi:MAG: hypothetical protein ABIO33_03565 [Leifsonia sp.]